jgi:hypothetical protein
LLKGFEGGEVSVRETDNPLIACAYRVTKGKRAIDFLINLSDKSETFKVDDTPFDGEISTHFGWTGDGQVDLENKVGIEGDTVVLPGLSVLTKVADI